MVLATSKNALPITPLASGPPGRGLKITRVFEFVVAAQSHQDHNHLTPLYNLWHGGDDQIGRSAHQQIDFIDVDQFGVYAGNDRGIRLVVVENELHGAPQQTAFCIDFLRPDLLRKQVRFARRRECTRERGTEPDLYRIRRLRLLGPEDGHSDQNRKNPRKDLNSRDINSMASSQRSRFGWRYWRLLLLSLFVRVDHSS